MKKYFFLFVLSMLFVGCSSDGSREIQIDECGFVPEHDNDKLEDMKNVTSIFEVVPGKYELAWKILDDAPLLKNFDVSLKLKLRLKKRVDVKQEVFDKCTDANIKNSDLPIIPFKFELLDANGKRLTVGNGGLQTFGISNLPFKEVRKTSNFYDKDKIMDFYRFLKSEPGTEIEVEMYTLGTSSDPINCVEDCKNAKGVICLVWEDDKDFERRIGTIQ